MNTFDRKTFFTNFSLSDVFQFPANALSKKDPNVETLRGIAIILVVTGHMIGYTNTGGMRVSDDSIFRYIYFSLEYIRLPLFTVISGWVYANKPVVLEKRSGFVKGKFRRLIIPMLVISTLLFLFRMIIPGTNTKPQIQDLPYNLFLPYDLYWYLYSLFLIFLAITLLDTTAFFRRIEGWFLTWVLAFAALFVSENFLDPVPNFFSFKGAVYLFPFFILGIGIHRYRDLLLSDKMTLLLAIVFVSSVIIQQLVWFGYLPMQERHSILGMSQGISGVLLLFRAKWKNNLLVWIGSFAYGIFLFHVFFTGGSRIVLTRLGVDNQFIILLLGVLNAIVFSILAEVIMKRSRFLRYYFLGLRKDNPQISG